MDMQEELVDADEYKGKKKNSLQVVGVGVQMGVRGRVRRGVCGHVGLQLRRMTVKKYKRKTK